MDVIGDLVARERRSDDLALRTDSRAGSYSYEKCCTNSWKTGNLLRHYGVRGDATVAVDAGTTPAPSPVVTFFGAALLGATVRFDPPSEVDARALVAPVERLDRYDPGPATQVIAYGDVPDTSGVAHFEAEIWSENPTEPPDAVEPDAAALATGEETVTHERLLAAVERVVERFGLDEDDTVALRAPLGHPGTVAAGVLAPLSVGGTVLLDPDQDGTLAVAGGGVETDESRVVDPETLL